MKQKAKIKTKQNQKQRNASFHTIIIWFNVYLKQEAAVAEILIYLGLLKMSTTYNTATNAQNKGHKQTESIISQKG